MKFKTVAAIRCTFPPCSKLPSSLPPLASTTAYGTFAIFNLIGMLLAGHLADRIDRRVLLVSIYVLRSLAFIVPFYVGTDYTLVIVFSIFVGIAFYATFPATIDARNPWRDDGSSLPDR